MLPAVIYPKSWAVIRLSGIQLICNMQKLEWASTEPVKVEGRLVTFRLNVPRQDFVLAPKRHRFNHNGSLMGDLGRYHLYNPSIKIDDKETREVIEYLVSQSIGRKVPKARLGHRLYRL